MDHLFFYQDFSSLNGALDVDGGPWHCVVNNMDDCESNLDKKREVS